MKSNEMDQLAGRYSEACTRAAVAALVVAALCASFTQRLANVAKLEAFGDYVLAREMLEVSLEELTSSQFWPAIAKTLNTTNVEAITVGEIAQLECVSSNHGPYARRKKFSEDRTEGRVSIGSISPVSVARANPSDTPPPQPLSTGMAPAEMPNPPVDLTIEIPQPCPGLEELQKAIAVLWDDELIDQARASSNETNVELYKWQLRRNRINAAVALNSRGEALSASLEIGQLKRLNQTPRTTIAAFSTIARESTSVTGPYSSDKQSVYVAATLAEIATLILVGYFFVNFHAARVAGLLNASGSLFATLWMNAVGKAFYFLLLISPAAAAIHLALNIAGFDGHVALALASISGLLTVNLVYRSLRIMLEDYPWLNLLARVRPRRKVSE